MSGLRLFKNLFAFGLFTGFYFLLAQSFSLAEASVGAVSSLLAIMALNALVALSPVHYTAVPDWPMMRSASPLQVLKGAIRVLCSIPSAARTRGSIGGFRELPIKLAGEERADPTRVGLAIWAVSLAPDTYAIKFDGEALVVHHAPACARTESADA